MKTVLATLLLMLFVVPGMVLGVDCNEKSQNFLSEGEEYFSSRDLVDFNPSSRSMVDGLYEKINGNWVGSEVFTECKGSLRAMKASSQRYDMESMVERGSHSAIVLRKVNYSGGGEVKEILDLFNFENVTYFEDRGSKMYVVEKYYRYGSNQSTIVIENFITLDSGGDRLSVTVKSFSNGSFAYLQEIDLVRG